VLQATGFENLLPTGLGLFAVATVEEAAEAIRAIRRDYPRHAAAARGLAREFFDSDTVLARLLRDLGLAGYRGWSGTDGMDKYLIVNADDFGTSTGVNRGILECHTRGVVTSTSLMVTGRAVAEAVSMSRDHPALAVGLHWDVWGEGERNFDLDNVPAV